MTKRPSDRGKKGNEIGRVQETQTDRVQAAVRIAKRVIRADRGAKASPAVRVHDKTGGRASGLALAGKASRAETAVGRDPNPNADLMSLAVKRIARRKGVRAIARKFKGVLKMPNKTGGKGKGKRQANSGAGKRTKRVSQGKNSGGRRSFGSQGGSFTRSPSSSNQ